MIYSLLVLSSPMKSTNAARFAEAVLKRGHQIARVFFMDDGVYHGQGHSVFPQDESHPARIWEALSESHDLELVLCVSSALKRGILDESEAARYEKGGTTMHPAFQIGGLGLLVDATSGSDRVVTFGG